MTIIIPIIKTKTYRKKVMNQWPYFNWDFKQLPISWKSSSSWKPSVQKSWQRWRDFQESPIYWRSPCTQGRFCSKPPPWRKLLSPWWWSYLVLFTPQTKFSKKNILKCTFFALKMYNFSSKIQNEKIVHRIWIFSHDKYQEWWWCITLSTIYWTSAGLFSSSWSSPIMMFFVIYMKTMILIT